MSDRPRRLTRYRGERCTSKLRLNSLPSLPKGEDKRQLHTDSDWSTSLAARPESTLSVDAYRLTIEAGTDRSDYVDRLRVDGTGSPDNSLDHDDTLDVGLLIFLGVYNGR